MLLLTLLLVMLMSLTVIAEYQQFWLLKKGQLLRTMRHDEEDALMQYIRQYPKLLNEQKCSNTMGCWCHGNQYIDYRVQEMAAGFIKLQVRGRMLKLSALAINSKAQIPLAYGIWAFHWQPLGDFPPDP